MEQDRSPAPGLLAFAWGRPGIGDKTNMTGLRIAEAGVTTREGAMEVHFKPEVQAKLEQMARESGRPSDELVEDAVAGYFDQLARTREMLDRRFDDLESGRVKPMDGAAAYLRLTK